MPSPLPGSGEAGAAGGGGGDSGDFDDMVFDPYRSPGERHRGSSHALLSSGGSGSSGGAGSGGRGRGGVADLGAGVKKQAFEDNGLKDNNILNLKADLAYNFLPKLTFNFEIYRDLIIFINIFSS